MNNICSPCRRTLWCAIWKQRRPSMLAADVVRRLWDSLSVKLTEDQLAGLMNDIELPLTAMLAEMEKAGVLIDADKLRTLGRRIVDGAAP